jgi:hypothetical protein
MFAKPSESGDRRPETGLLLARRARVPPTPGGGSDDVRYLLIGGLAVIEAMTSSVAAVVEPGKGLDGGTKRQ